jgi:hypothetical protein
MGHPPATTRRTKSPPLARKRKKAVLAAAVAMQAKEAVFQNATFQKRSKLVLDETRNGTASCPLQGEERLQMFGHDLVQNGMLRIAGTIAASGILHEPHQRNRGASTKQQRRTALADRGRRLSRKSGQTTLVFPDNRCLQDDASAFMPQFFISGWMRNSG